jgi:NAD(P)-dependent dehydrogenase (short-subunit alcohol dehydrogenase family)
MTNPSRHALVVGASRGLGLGLVGELLGRGWTVTATTRGSAPGLDALASPQLHTDTVDMNDDAAVTALHQRLKGTRFDLVFVNAGVSNDSKTPLHEVPRDTATQIFQTNTISPIRFAEVFQDLVAPGGTIAVMTSILGSVSLNTRGGWEVYRASKAALNTLARSFQVRHADAGWSMVLMHPGWVRTDMGGSAADIDVATSVRGMVDVLEQPARGGCVYLNYKGETLTW